MSEEILINVTPQETRVALVENGMLQEVLVERSENRGYVGNIYKGKVVRILPGMEAAFVELGLARTGFLHVSDVLSHEQKIANGHDGGAEKRSPHIAELLRPGKDVIVQVVKEPIASKGARLTTEISVPSRYLVYLPGSSRIGVSQRIREPETRDRLRALVERAMEEEGMKGGVIVRTMAETADDDEIIAELKYLRRVCSRIKKRMQDPTVTGEVHTELPLTFRIMRDILPENIEKVRIDSRETFNAAVEFAREFVPELEDKMEYYPGERPIFDLYSIEDEIIKALGSKVPLKSGGYLVIDPTEAMTTIDVNTGGFVGRKNLEETLFKTNMEAAYSIARQLRLRNIGGIIIIDFIDMGDPEHQRQVLRTLENALARDHAKTSVNDMSPLGLVEVTRKRTRESLQQTLCEPCPVCEGRGVLRTARTVCYEIFRELLREVRQFEAKEYMVIASQVVIDMLLDEESSSLADLQDFIGKPIRLQVEPSYHQEQYDVVLL